MKHETQAWLRSAGALVAAGALIFGMTGCNGCGANTSAPITNSADGADPADANLATPDSSQPTQVMGQSAAYTPRQSSETYGSSQQAPAPIVNGNASQNEAYNYNQQQQGYYDNGQQGYSNGAADTYPETEQAPPELPVYQQPPAPDPDDIWTPGYWGYANTGYYWTPGAWVAAPFIGALWTPGYWGWYGSRYRFHHGYWGRHIGYYGGIDYGCGYIGTGYYGGYWNRDHFYYNNAVTRVSPRITNLYERNVVVNNVRYTSTTINRVSFNGGRGGVNYQPRPYELAAMHEQHVGPVPAQQQFHREAAMNRANFYADNHGRPAQLALAQPVRTERIAAPPEVNRGGFGRGPAGQPGQPNPGGNPQQQRGFAEAQHNQQLQQQNHNLQQRGLMEQGRNAAEQQRGIAEQQRNAQLQQHNQADQQRNQMAQQRGIVEQQRNQQLQQNNNALQQRNGAEQQRGLMEQQRNQQMQQRNAVDQQRMQNMSPGRNMPEQQQQQRIEQPRQFNPQPQQQQRVEQPRQQFSAQPQHIEQPRQQMAPQQHFEQHAAPAPVQHMEAPHAAPAAPAGGGGHPGGGGPHH